MKKNIIISVIISIIFIGGLIYLYFSLNSSNKLNSSYYNTSRTSISEKNNENTNNNNNNINNNINNNKEKHDEEFNDNSLNNITQKKEPIETEIGSYTTKIRTKYPERQNNITIACSTLNGTIVNPGTTFSFCDTLGKATKSKGYEEANVFQDGKEISALGGGKCQVSSTLYNAVLSVPNLEVTERHPHSGKVYYVPKGKDAAVSYGSYDFKFKNNTSNKIKIKASNTENELKIQLLKIE